MHAWLTPILLNLGMGGGEVDNPPVTGTPDIGVFARDSGRGVNAQDLGRGVVARDPGRGVVARPQN